MFLWGWCACHGGEFVITAKLKTFPRIELSLVENKYLCLITTITTSRIRIRFESPLKMSRLIIILHMEFIYNTTQSGVMPLRGAHVFVF